MQFGASSQIYTCICICVPNALSRTGFIHVLHVVQIRRTEGWCEAVWLSSWRRSQHNFPEELIHDFLENKSLKAILVYRGARR